MIYLQDTGGEEATKADAGDSEVTESKADEEGEVTEPKVDNNGEVTAPEEQPQEEDPYQNSPVEIPTRYPGGIYQDDVGRPYEHSHVCGDDHADTEPLLADDDNMLARRRWPGGELLRLSIRVHDNVLYHRDRNRGCRSGALGWQR